MSPSYNPAEHVPPPIDLYPTLRVVADAGKPTKYRAYLTCSLARRLGLQANQPINLLPPGSYDTYWHLDLRTAAHNRVRWYADTRPRIHGLVLPTGLLAGASSLTLRLVPGEPAFPGYYPLEPCAQHP